MKRTMKLSRLFQPQYLLIWVLLAMFAVFFLASGDFRTAQNILEILRQTGIIAIVILGLTWIVATGEIDLTFPEIAALTGMIIAYGLKNGLSPLAATMTAFGISLMFGLVNGLLIGYLKFPALITTIGTAGLATATANILGKGAPIYITSSTAAIHGLVYGKVFGIPVLFIIALVVYLICRFIQDRTVIGQHLYALGENRQATREAGIKESRILLAFFLLSSALASIGGILLTAHISSGNPAIGSSFFLDGLTAVFLGALIIKAGQPNLIGTFIGVVILAVLGNGLTLLGLPFYIGTIIKGALLVVGVSIVTVSKNQRQKGLARPQIG